MSPVTVAAVQAAPEFLDRDATIGKVIALAEKAASRARLAGRVPRGGAQRDRARRPGPPARGNPDADLGLRDVTVARRHLDPVGHYNRPEIFQLQVNTSPRPAVIESGTIAAISQLNGGSDEHHASDERARA